MRDACPLMIFAAGFGTRMGALTADRPKPMIEIAGRRMIDRAIDLGEAAGCRPIVANTHYRADLLAPVLADRGVAVSHETPDILDTGGGLRRALPLLGSGRIATLNPDVAWSGPNPLTILLDSRWPEGAGALLLVVPEVRAHGRTAPGDFSLAADGRLSRGGAFVYTGVQLIEGTAVQGEPGRAFSLNAVWNALAAEGRLFGAVYSGHWCDAGHPDGLALAETLLAAPA
jgi:N-acetyl-alpha-D-muramate 1-phosphate uridylyltransferase